MLLSLAFLIHSFGLIQVKDLSDSTKGSGYSLLHGIKELSNDRYYIHRPDKNDRENSYITIQIYSKLKFRDVPTDPQKLWPKAVVPYVISRKCNKKQKKIILEAMKRYKLQTCVRFTGRKNETAFIMITPGRRCGANLGNKKDVKLPVVKGCYELTTIILELMNILDLKVKMNKHDGPNKSKNFERDIHQQRNDAMKSNFAKVNNIFGCNIEKSNDSRDRISGRPLEVAAETNRSNRRKRNAGMSHHSRKQFSEDPPVKKCTEHNATTIEVPATEVTIDNNITSTGPATQVTTDNIVTARDLATEVTTVINITLTELATEITTDNNITSTDPATDVTTDNNVTSTDPPAKKSTEHNATSIDLTATEVTTDDNATSTDPASEVTTDNHVTLTEPVTEINTDQNITTTDLANEITTGINVTSTEPATQVIIANNVTSTDPTTEVTTHNKVASTDPATRVTTNNNITSTDRATTVLCSGKCGKQISEIFFRTSHLTTYHKIDIISSVLPRTSIVDPARLWSKPEIPYVVSEDKYDSSQKSLIRKAIDEFGDKTCVKFIPRTTEVTYIAMQPNKGCSSVVGKIEGGVSNVSLIEGCFRQGTILHELMHALGFVHEQNRPDRDKYVMVMYENILPEAIHNFKKEEENSVTSFNQSYDYGSVMHYGMYDFAIDDDRPTLVPLQAGVEIGQRVGFSEKDIIKINKLFNCTIEEDKKIIEPKPAVSVKDFSRKFLEYVSKLFKSIYRTLRRFQFGGKEKP